MSHRGSAPGLATIMTWNIWHGALLEQIVQAVTRLRPDILALQEVIAQRDATGQRDQAAAIAAALGAPYRAVYDPAVATQPGSMMATQGNALISRFPILDHQRDLLSASDQHRGDAETEPRIAVRATLAVGDQPLHVLTTHLAYSEGFVPSEMRRRQIDVLLSLVPRERAILLGDFNSPPDGTAIQRISAVIPHAAHDLSVPTYGHVHGSDAAGLAYRLDYIFATPDVRVQSCTVLAEEGSDHRPVVAVIEC